MPAHKRDRILKIYEEQERLGEELKTLLGELQVGCPHEIVIETKYVPDSSGLFSAEPPRRICAICGIEEEGWGSGYKGLTRQPVKTVPRHKFYEFRKLQPMVTIAVPESILE